MFSLRRLNDTDINTPPTVALPTVSEENEPEDNLAVELPIFNLGRITPLKSDAERSWPDSDELNTNSKGTEKFDVYNTEVLQVIILEKEVKLIDKKYFGELFTKKGMMSKEGERIENHPHFQHTPVFLRIRTRLNSENPPPAKRNTGG